ncbi:MAG: hypothetical protein ACE1ZQ_09360 [Ignavibacteriaceae bacterium]
MLGFNWLKLTKKTAILSLTTDGDKNELAAIALLFGAYNPLRKHSDNNCPINLEKLTEYKERMDNLIYDVINDMNVNVIGIEKI